MDKLFLGSYPLIWDKVLHELTVDELKRCRLVCRELNEVVSCHDLFLNRVVLNGFSSNAELTILDNSTTPWRNFNLNKGTSSTSAVPIDTWKDMFGDIITTVSLSGSNIKNLFSILLICPNVANLSLCHPISVRLPLTGVFGHTSKAQISILKERLESIKCISIRGSELLRSVTLLVHHGLQQLQEFDIFSTQLVADLLQDLFVHNSMNLKNIRFRSCQISLKWWKWFAYTFSFPVLSSFVYTDCWLVLELDNSGVVSLRSPQWNTANEFSDGLKKLLRSSKVGIKNFTIHSGTHFIGTPHNELLSALNPDSLLELTIIFSREFQSRAAEDVMRISIGNLKHFKNLRKIHIEQPLLNRLSEETDETDSFLNNAEESFENEILLSRNDSSRLNVSSIFGQKNKWLNISHLKLIGIFMNALTLTSIIQEFKNSLQSLFVKTDVKGLFTNDIMQMISKKLRKLMHLEIFYADCLSDEGLKDLTSLENLRTLTINDSPEITDTGIANNIVYNGLCDLDLSNCSSITLDGLHVILKNNSSLKTLKVRHMKRSGTDLLKKVSESICPHVKIIRSGIYFASDSEFN